MNPKETAMTLTSSRPGNQLVPYTELSLTGPANHIHRAIEQARRSGQLVTATTPRPISATDRRHHTHLRLRTHPIPDRVPVKLDASIRWAHITRPRTRRHHLSPAGIIALALVAVAAIVGFTAGYLGLAADLLAKALTVLFGLAVLAGLLAALPSLLSGGRHHCPGCRH
jgi:hypothetical protein